MYEVSYFGETIKVSGFAVIAEPRDWICAAKLDTGEFMNFGRGSLVEMCHLRNEYYKILRMAENLRG